MRILLGVLCWLLASSALAAETRNLLVLGDSLSAAYNMPVAQGWVSLLSARLQDAPKGKAQPWQVVNASISGETTSGGLARLPQALTEHRPAVVLIELGANDGLRGLPLRQTRANLDRMIKAAQAAGARVGLIGIELPVNYGQAYRDRFRQMYQDLAQQHQVPLLPFLLVDVAEDIGNFQDDQVHPTSAAQPIIMETVWAWLEPWL